MRVERKIVLVTETIDRDKEIIDVQGCDIKAYQNNPLLLYRHNFYNVLGTLINIRKEGTTIVADGIDFADALNDECEVAKQQFIEGKLVAFSTGVIVHKYLEDAPFTHRRLVESEMIENSLVPVGSNPDTLVATKSYSRKALDFSNSNSNPNKKGMEIKIIAKSLGLGEDAKDDDVLAKAKELGSLDAKYNALVKSVEALAGDDEFGKKLLQKDPVLAMEYFAKKQAEKPVEDNPQGVVTGGVNHIVDLLKNANLGVGTAQKKFRDYSEKELLDMKKTDIKKYEEAFEAEFGFKPQY